jgi:peptidoglycan/xylan/chitin deacetylase (PgdA/CDA1 family)
MRTPVLEYHDVVPEGADDRSGFPGPSAAAYKVTPQAMAEHIEFLRSLPDDDRALRRARGGDDRAEPWLLTFDDGGESALSEIAPLLEDRGYRGHFFVATGSIGTRGFLSGPQVQELRRRGHRIGSHSHSHPLMMARLGASEIRDEWTRSTGILADLLGEPVVTASVPGGYFSHRVAEAARDAGITQLFTSEPTARVAVYGAVQVHGRYVIRRGQVPGFAAAVVRGDGVTVARETLSWNAKKALKAVMGDSYVQVRDIVRKAVHRDD